MKTFLSSNQHGDTSKSLVIPPSQKDSIPESGNFLLEIFKNLLIIKEMTCGKKIGGENVPLFLVYWL